MEPRAKRSCKASGSDFDADQFKKKRDCMTIQLKASVNMILFLVG